MLGPSAGPEQGLVPLGDALSKVSATKSGEYSVSFPASVRVGVVVFSGFVMSYVERCAQDFTFKDKRIATQKHCRNLSVNFFRPLFAEPQVAILKLQLENLGRAWSTLRFEIFQSGKKCQSGTITMTNMQDPGLNSLFTGWKLDPQPAGPPTTTSVLEADEDSGWLPFSTPYKPGGFRAYHSYIHFVVPEKAPAKNTVDQWVRPAWVDPSLPGGAVWTNELVHFLLDGSISILDNLLPKGEASGDHDCVIKTAQAQRKARREGRKDWIDAGEQGNALATSRVYTSLAFQTEIKKRLPEEGVKWLFLRGQTKAVRDDHMDQESIVLDESGEIIGMSHQVLQVIDNRQKSKQVRL